MGKPKTPWTRADDLKTALLDRCDAYCAATDTPQTLLSLALTRHGNTLKRLRKGGDIGIHTYDTCVSGLARLEPLAGLVPDQREWPTGAELVRALVHRCESYCAATGVRITRLGKAIGHPALIARLKEATDIKLSSYDKHMTALDAIEETVLRAFGRSEEGEDHGKAEAGQAIAAE